MLVRTGLVRKALVDGRISPGTIDGIRTPARLSLATIATMTGLQLLQHQVKGVVVFSITPLICS
jgi:hypothetical protein